MIIGINPFVFLPEPVLKSIFKQAAKEKGHIQVRGTVNGNAFRQTLVKYSGEWRLYINTIMLKNSPKRIGETIEITIAFDPEERTIAPHPKLVKALNEHPEAQKIFNNLAPSKQFEIVRYIASLKTETSVDKNIIRAIDFLSGKGRFVGRDRP
ncbi:MAG: YdeI/OmpD-associated family protein [Niabella sp.]|nr:YdeI/OmpD-associated family protein [Niabella sp.]